MNEPQKQKLSLSPEEALEMAVKMHRSKQYASAEEIYHQLLAKGLFIARVCDLLGVLLFETRRAEASVSFFERSIGEQPDVESTYSNYALTRDLIGDLEGAIEVCKRGIQAVGDSIPLNQKLCSLCIRTQKYREAIEPGELAVERNAIDFSLLANLNAAYFFVGDSDGAKAYGERALLFRDAASGVESSTQVKQPADNPEPTTPADGSHVISFSLWGNNDFYLQGAIRNAELVSKIYPGWVGRFYCGTSTDSSVIRRLNTLGSQVVEMEEEAGFSGTAWRFLVADDPTVRRFICRDADSRLSEREKLAVDDWIQSAKPFHNMRDAIVHCDVIFAGMWGGVGGILPNIRELIDQHFTGTSKFSDQTFLAEWVWPLIKDSVLVHDAHYPCFDARPFPSGDLAESDIHVGAGVPVSMDPPRTL